MKNSKVNKNGFSLIEVMISLALVGGLLITLIYTINYHLQIAERQKTITICTLLAKEKLYQMEKSPSITKGQFDFPYSDFYYETSMKRSSVPSMIEIIVKVNRDNESVVFSKLIWESK
ncbi:MAG: type II secretion system GspH family protein [Thermodesulfovibrionales bacterium]|nr:type II secretion system GspH family protein [Thermodesulfovibrionales bacterium]